MARADLLGVEERHLLLITQHLERGLTDHREVERRALGSGVGERELVNQGGLAGARRTGHQVERILGQTTTEHLVQTRDARRQQLQSRICRLRASA